VIENRINRLTLASIFLGSLTLSVEFGWGMKNLWMLLWLLIGAIWMFSRRYEISWIDSVLMCVFSLAAAFGVLQGGPAILALLVVLSVLTAWQLANLQQSIGFIADENTTQMIIKRRLIRLLGVITISFVLAVGASLFNFTLNFWAALLLAVLALIGLAQLITYLNRESQ